MKLPGAAPFLMAQATLGATPQPCPSPAPTLVEALAAIYKVTLTWSDEHSVDPLVVGYNVYYDQAGKAQFHAEAGLTTTFEDSGLHSSQQYCYRVSSNYATCESSLSNTLCAVPDPGELHTSIPLVLHSE